MEFEILREIVVLFVLSIAVVLVCHRLHIPSIVGFLITGALCGPSALGLVPNMAAVDTMAEVGVALLLFTIGMELSAGELMRLKKPLFVGGSAQVLLTAGAVAGATVWWAGLSRALVFGCLVALSSTAIVLSLFQQKAQTESPQGRMCLAVLIFQDLAIVPMMLLFPLLGGELDTDASHMLWTVGKSVIVLGGLALFSRFVLPRLMLRVVRVRSRDLMLMTTLGLCLAVAMVTSSLGLSLSLGAFLAGLMLAESEYSLNALENVLPFKEVFTSIFFMSVGMLLNMAFFVTHLPFILLVAGSIAAVKIAMVIPVVRLVGYSMRTAIITAFSLAQIGEFSFVLARSALGLGLLDTETYQIFLAASIVTMSLTPVLMAVAPRAAARWLRKSLAQTEAEAAEEGGPDGAARDSEEKGIIRDGRLLRDHLIIIGFGIGGKNLASGARELGIPYIISEMNPDTVARYRDQEPIRHGDASFPLVLEHLGVARARVLAIVISDPAGTRAIIAAARALNPALYIVVRSRFVGEVSALRELGANDVIPEEFETSIEVFARVLNHYLVPRQTIDSFIARIRQENYGMLRQVSMASTDVSDLRHSLPDLQSAAYTVEQGSPLEGKTLAESRLGRAYSVTAAGIRRDGKTLTSPPADTMFLAGDVVYLFATQTALQAAAVLFRTPEARETA
ncbi:MAG: cation:proton antiporter [Desulfovibrionaceae bacterium]|nr:cation:proton antiporter [Desulfovibrionaceae bacterium]